MKNNKKGFTLIELLVVIAILAIILLIAAPTILGVLEKARKNTFRNQVLLYVEGLKTQLALSASGDEYADMTINWTTTADGKDTATVNVTDIPMDTEKLEGGTITVTSNNGEYTFELTNVHDNDWKVASAKINSENDSDNFTVDKITKYTGGSTPAASSSAASSSAASSSATSSSAASSSATSSSSASA